MTFNSKDNNLSQSDSVFSNPQSIKDYDKDLWDSFEKEANRQEDHIELIASENYASNRILEAQGSLLTNKYAEGYPSKRYYGTCARETAAAASSFTDLATKKARSATWTCAMLVSSWA